MRHIVTMLALFIAIGLAGCATTKDLDTLRIEVQQANMTADEALKVANEANATAQDAKIIAQDANATSTATEEKIDRMFKKAMHK